METQQRPRQMALAMRSQMVLSAEDEEVLWWVLQRHAAAAATSAAAYGGGSDCGVADEPCLNYDDFTQVAAECREAIGPSVDLYFQASTFLRLARDEGGCVPAAALFRYCTARSTQIQLRVELGVLDAAGSSQGSGALSAVQLEQWLLRHAPLAACSEQLVSDADWCTVVGARLQLLHGRRGRLLVKDLVGSTHVNDLSAALHALEAAEAAAAAAAADEEGEGIAVGEGDTAGGATAAVGAALAAAQQRVMAGWFSPAAAAALRSRFAELDADGDGRLSEQEFANFSQGTMTRFAIQRLLAHHCGSSSRGGAAGGSNGRGGGGGAGVVGSSGGGSRHGQGMDFPAFCTFCAAWEMRHHPAAVRYFFPLLDLRGCGYVTQADLYSFFRDVYALWVALGQYAELRVEDVLSETTDLLRAPDPNHITPADFQRCGAAGTVFGLLLDVNLFWEYENREALLQQQQQQAAAAGPP